MPTTLAYPHIVKPTDAPAYLERTPRVRVAQVVMSYFDLDSSIDTLCREYPYLTKAEAHAAMLYYWDHQGEIDAEIAEEAEILERWERERRLSPPSKIEEILRSRRAD